MVLDPFLGTGTTAAVAKRLGRRFIGLERDEAYADAAAARIAAVQPLPEERGEHDARQARAAAHPLRHAGRARRGPARLACWWTAPAAGARRWPPTARVRCGRAQGSIHRVGALVQEAPSCNGWTFWHVETRDGRLRVLDEFRAEIAGGAAG